jgi:type IV secretion system protein VirD4
MIWAKLGLLCLIPPVWIASASFIYCWVKGPRYPFEFPYNQWLSAAPWWQYDPWTTIGVVAGAAVPTVVVVLVAIALIRHRLATRHRRLLPPPGGGLRPLQSGVTDNHGHARWLSIPEALRLFPGPTPGYGGVVVGEALRVDLDRSVAGVRFLPHDRSTWGRGGTAPLLIDPCTDGSGHSLIFAGTGSFKSVSAVCTILHWTGSSVVLDPSTELGPMLHSALEAQDKKVVHIGIRGEQTPMAVGVNVLGWIDVTDPEAEVHVRTVAGWVYDDETVASQYGTHEDPFFAPLGRELVTCLLAHVLYDAEPQDRTLATLAAGISMPETDMLTILEGIKATSQSQMARRIAGALMKCKAEETFSGVYLNAVKACAWCFTSAYADMVSDPTFNPRDLLDGKTTVFLNISLRTLESTPAIARVLVGSLLNTIYEADGQTKGCVLFLLDEAARLGRLKALETARDTGRKYKVRLHMLMQSTGQLLQAWGRDGARSWIDAAAWIGYAAVRAGGAGKELSEQLGTHGVLAHSEGDNRGRSKPFGFSFGSTSTGSNSNVHEIKRALMSPAEFQSDLREDEIIIVPATSLPLRCSRAIYFRRPEIVEQIQRSRFVNVAAE